MLPGDRVECPCCGYPTLTERAAYEICELCNWEDDGQGDAEANEVWEGSNSDYSLAEARRNFLIYRVMYAPGRDQRITGGDSALEYETKAHLMEAFDRLASVAAKERSVLQLEIAKFEKVLEDETSRQVREYEKKMTPPGKSPLVPRDRPD